MSSFTTCPACNYTRQPTDFAPDWQCPKCQKAYVKTARLAQSNEAKSRQPVTPGESPEQAPYPGPERKHARYRRAILVAVAVLGVLLIALYLLKGKKVHVPSTAVQTAAPLQTLLNNAKGYYAFLPRWKDHWKADSESWEQQAVISVRHTAGTSGLGVIAVAQSFVPRASLIKAIQVNLYPTGAAEGWVRFQITDDASGTPGQEIAAAWFWINAQCPVPHGGYMTVPFADIAVDPAQTYWFTVVEFHHPKSSPYHLTNLGVSENDTYPDGRILFPPKHALKGLFDANFRIISDYTSPPFIRPASGAEKQFLPSQEDQDDSKHLWTQEIPRSGE